MAAMNFLFASPQLKMAESALKKALKGNDIKKGDFNFVEVDLREDGLPLLLDELHGLPLGYEHKLVVLSGVETGKGKGKKKGNASLEPLYEYLRSGGDGSIDLYILLEGKLDKKDPLVSALLAGGGKVTEVQEFSEEEWKRYIPAWLSKRGVNISSDALDEFIARLGGDYARFLSEANKLVSYKGGTGLIGLSDVKDLVHRPLEENAFALTDALFSRYPAASFRIYRELREGGVEPILLSRMILKQLILLSELSYLLTHGLNSDRAAEELGIHPYRAKLAARTVARMSKKDIDAGMDSLFEFEKSVLSGQKDADIAFLECLASFAR